MNYLKKSRCAALLVLMLANLAAFAAQSTQRTQPQRQTNPTAQPGAHANRFGLAKPLPRTSGAIRLATYNTLNLFDHVDDPKLQGEFDDKPMATAHERCVQMAKAIRALDADILALQEVESLEALEWFRDTYLKDMGYAHLASYDVGYYRGVECSLLSRFEITSSSVWPEMSLDDVKRDGIGWEPAQNGGGGGGRDHPGPLKFQRSPLMVNIKTPQGYELTVFSLHHKAGRDSNYHREAEALKIVEILQRIQKEDPSRNIVVMGDFNAAPWDKSLRVYLAAGMIDTLAHRTTGRDDVESPLYKTHESDRVLDFILLNSAAHRELVIGSAFVLGTLFPPPGYDFRKDPHPPGYASDHYPVAIELRPKEIP